jgi:hypothetical protein
VTALKRLRDALTVVRDFFRSRLAQPLTGHKTAVLLPSSVSIVIDLLGLLVTLNLFSLNLEA